MTNNKKQVEDALIEVRKAYRLLYTYQRRVMDIMQFIGDQVSRSYHGGFSKFSNTAPREGRGSLDNWAWDWLNMYCYEFHFGDKFIEEDTITFSVWLVSDTGCYDSAADALNIENFSNPEISTTKLVFVIGKNILRAEFREFYPDLKAITNDFIEQKDKSIMLAKSFNLSSFLNIDETKNCLNEFASFCHRNNILEFNILSS